MRKKLNHFVLSTLFAFSIAIVTTSVWAKVTPELPPAPTNVQASDGTYGNLVEITWDGTSSEGIYEILRQGEGGGQIKVVPYFQTYYEDIPPEIGVTYSYWVRSCLDGEIACTSWKGPDSGWANFCYALSLSLVGFGDLDGNPENSAGCIAGEYIENEEVNLTATPTLGWHLTSWTGTDDDTSTSTVNVVTMPAIAHAVTVTFTLDDHTVTFDANGGTGTMIPQVANVPTALTLNTFT
ncbi:MAG: hypothetical protein P8Y72_09015, partial [Anaerolineales bacterium]